MDSDSPHDFELPVFTEPQKDPEPIGYENAVRAFEEIITEHRLQERPRAVELFPEFRMDEPICGESNDNTDRRENYRALAAGEPAIPMPVDLEIFTTEPPNWRK